MRGTMRYAITVVVAVLLATSLGCNESATRTNNPFQAFVDGINQSRDADVVEDTDDDTDVEPDTEPDTEPDADPDIVEDTDDDADVEPDAEPDIVEDTEPELDTDDDTDVEPDTEPDIVEDTNPDTGPVGMCERFDGLTGTALTDAIFAELNTNSSCAYDTARDAMYAVDGIDVFDGYLEGLYTGLLSVPDGSRTPYVDSSGNQDFMNTEHVWPQSQGAGSAPAQCDIHHLFPTSADANSRRSNYPFGESACNDGGSDSCDYIADGGLSVLGSDEVTGNTIWEVRPLRRGDVARAKFYFSIRYGYGIPSREEEVLRDWHAEDEVDAREETRNDRIEDQQGNRNVFVDCPDLVDRIADF